MRARLRLRLRGIVQGVGFRPFVHRLAHALGLVGWVRNDAGGVTLEVQGDESLLSSFCARLRSEAPAAARIDAIEQESIALEPDAAGFEIFASAAGGASRAVIGPDLCVCPACLAELFDPTNRRYRYAFTNCTDCGPRYTIAARLPYDRAHTSMAGFTQCPACLAEYADPLNRRFHAEPNACPVCGPQLRLLDASGQAIAGDPIAETLVRLRRGEIVALKGLGGFHLACDARNAAAVAELRRRKDREEKPLAIMVANLASLAGLVEVSLAEAAELESRARPIVLLQKLPGTDAALPDVAPDLAWLGVMLPYTPLHYLLYNEAAGRSSGIAWLNAAQPLALVMTSANPHGEPLVANNEEALRTLADIADAFLWHDRDILIRTDDSVLRCTPDGGKQFIRRARGFTPTATPLVCCEQTLTPPAPLDRGELAQGTTRLPSLVKGRGREGLGLSRSKDVLALGGFYKNTLCFTRGNEAFLSQHIGDLDRVANCRALEAAVEHLQGLLNVQPQAVAHDLHPDFFSTQLALRLAERWQVPAIGVQHHHAHIAAVLAEHCIDEPVLGLALDGVGMGTDGAAWGGELLRVEGASFERFGHLRPIGLPGGDRAAREPWRIGAAALALLGRHDEIATRFAAEPGAALVAQMLARGVAQTTSLGRWFDAAAGLLGVQARMSFEGQAAMRLEGLAERYINSHHPQPFMPSAPQACIEARASGLVLDLAPLLQALLDEPDAGRGAALFHAGLIQAVVDWVTQAAESSGIRVVACAGGCFLNAILAQGLRREFTQRGLRMLEAHAAPPGDGGLALGQAWVAQRRLLVPA
ncbi:carbamoyltransferase HypF [Uliginosibacterium sp. 31-16]|uniref:carbamoyltransferase HypF n=1 Tax=Uliginosibacterium sp. 31-16 TaxID=3068315 RepID=UPI00273FE4EC|nr:carbamoyltransferase HypF [Uliginosibacterium sp. 31-16]MDP5240907.1 carbamoyltransferase HypF [Uliginosibacterium sp. 31-16]